jgi:cytolysin (calcineurin-like family phosphatase)
MARIYHRTATVNMPNLLEADNETLTKTLTYEDAFYVVKNHIQSALAKPYANISTTYAYLDILGAIKKIETSIKK